MGSGSKSGGGGSGVPGTTMTPEAKKMVQRIKEIVDKFSESEIYAMLKECDMDPDAAVQRLLSLDNFQEVKSKRERRKESKETQDTRSWGNNTSSSYGVKGANERNLGRNAALLTSPNDYGNAPYKKENGSSSSASRTTGKTLYQQPSSQGDSFGADEGRHSTGTVDVISSSVQQHPRAQSAWSGTATGQISMADIVKMGRPQNKASDIPRDVATSYPSDHFVKDPHILAPSQPDSCSPDPSYAPKRTNEFSNNADQNEHYDQWPVIEQPTTTTESSALDVSTVLDADISTNQANLYSDGGNMSMNCLSRDVQLSDGDVAREDLRFNFTKTSVSSRQNSMNRPGAAGHMYERLEGNDSDMPSRSHSVTKADDNIITVSSAAEELERLSLGKEDHVKSPTGDNCTVVFPNNLQALAGDCSHLSFGTYKSSNDAALSGPPTLDPPEKNMGALSAAMHATGGLDSRYFGYDADAQTESYGTHKMTADAGIYDLPGSTRPELMNDTVYDANYGREYIDPLSVPDSSFESISQSSTFPFPEADRTVRNQPTLSNELLAYLASQQRSSRYGGSGSPTISMAEVTNSGAFLPQQSSQTLPGASGPGLQQLLTANPYPQSSLNAEQLANIIGYPSAQSQSQYKPYAQESYPGGSSYPGGMKYGLQRYNSGASLSNLPVSNANTSAYASLGSSTNIPGSFPHNPSVGPAATNTDGYDPFLSQYNDANYFNQTLRQNDSTNWDYGTVSRAMPSVPGNAYYGSQAQNQQHLGYRQNQQHLGYRQNQQHLGYRQNQQHLGYRQNQQHLGYRQNQQASQHYAALGYPDSYNSQTRMPQEFQRQSLSDPAVYSPTASPKQQQHWPRRY